MPNKYEPDAHTLNQIDALFAYHTPHGDQTERFARADAGAARPPAGHDDE
jgi:hypothetical protein